MQPTMIRYQARANEIGMVIAVGLGAGFKAWFQVYNVKGTLKFERSFVSEVNAIKLHNEWNKGFVGVSDDWENSQPSDVELVYSIG